MPSSIFSPPASQGRRFGGAVFSDQGNVFGQSLGTITNPTEQARLGMYGHAEGIAQRDAAWAAFLTALADQGVSPAILRALRNSRGMAETGYTEAQQRDPDIRFVNYLGGLDPNRTYWEQGPTDAYRRPRFRGGRAFGAF